MTLQRDANRLLGFTAQQTLNYAQSAFTKKKLITYPRTDSRFLTRRHGSILPRGWCRLLRGLFRGEAVPVHAEQVIS
ncbi:MAG: DNA topoisomerase [Faecalibacterium prausnitzii]